MSRIHRYEARLVWTGAARGPTTSYQVYSRDYSIAMPGKPVLAGSADAFFRGDPGLHNPEELLLAALSACHMLSYLALCARVRLPVLAYEDHAAGAMGARPDGKEGFLEVVLRPAVTIAAGADLARATALHHDAHAECYIASSVNFPVRNEPLIRHAPAAPG